MVPFGLVLFFQLILNFFFKLFLGNTQSFKVCVNMQQGDFLVFCSHSNGSVKSL